jgi:hypothetical protein
MEKPETEKRVYSMSELGFDKLWNWSLHEDNLFSGRVNFMLVGESMLFAGFATLLSADSLHKWALLTIGILGFFVSLVWLWVAKVQLYLVNRPIQKKLKDICLEYREIAEKRKKLWQHPHTVIGVILPIVLMLAWVALLCVGLW